MKKENYIKFKNSTMHKQYMNKVSKYILLIGIIVFISLIISLISLMSPSDSTLNDSINKISAKMDTQFNIINSNLNSLNDSLQLESEEHFLTILNRVAESTVRILGCPSVNPDDINAVLYVDSNLGACDLSTGFSFNDEGNIMTSNHGVKPPHKVVIIMLNDGTQIPVTQITGYENLDLAILYIKTNVPKLDFESTTARIGTSVAFIGFPLGKNSKIVTKGTISGVILHNYTENQIIPVYTLGASVNYGNSGGAVFSLKTGKIIGIINQLVGGMQGIGISTMINQDLINEIQQS